MSLIRRASSRRRAPCGKNPSTNLGLLLSKDFRDELARRRGICPFEASLRGIQPSQVLRLGLERRLALRLDRGRADLPPSTLPFDQEHVAIDCLVHAERLKLVRAIRLEDRLDRLHVI